MAPVDTDCVVVLLPNESISKSSLEAFFGHGNLSANDAFAPRVGECDDVEVSHAVGMGTAGPFQNKFAVGPVRFGFRWSLYRVAFIDDVESQSNGSFNVNW